MRATYGLSEDGPWRESAGIPHARKIPEGADRLLALGAGVRVISNGDASTPGPGPRQDDARRPWTRITLMLTLTGSGQAYTCDGGTRINLLHPIPVLRTMH